MDTENKLKIMHNSLRLRISGASKEGEGGKRGKLTAALVGRLDSQCWVRGGEGGGWC